MSNAAVNTKLNEMALKSGVWYVFSTILLKTIGVISTPIFARLMTVEEYGMVATFIAWQTLLLPIFSLQLNASVGRAKLDFANNYENYVGSMICLGWIVDISLLIVGWLLSNWLIPFLGIGVTATILLGFMVLFHSVVDYCQNWYRYRYEYKQNIFISVFVSVGTVVLSLVLMLFHNDNMVFWRLLGLVVPHVCLGLFFILKFFINGKLHFNWQYSKYGLMISVPLVVHAISLNILGQINRIFINNYCGAADVGLYSLAYNYGILLMVVMVAFSEAWLPWFHDQFFADKLQKIKDAVKPFVVLPCYIGLASIAFAIEAIHILGGAKYSKSVDCVAPIVIGVVCQTIYTHYVDIEMHFKKTQIVAIGTLLAALLNISLNYYFIPHYGYIAAAYTTLASYLALLVLHFSICRWKFNIYLYDDKFMFLALLVTSIVGWLIVMTYPYTELRYALIVVGFISFVWYFKKYFWFVKQKFL